MFLEYSQGIYIPYHVKKS